MKLSSVPNGVEKEGDISFCRCSLSFFLSFFPSFQWHWADALESDDESYGCRFDFYFLMFFKL